MRTIDFLDIPVAARVAFAQAVNQNRVLLASPDDGGSVPAAIVGVLVIGVATTLGFGRQNEPFASRGPWLMAAYAVGLAALALSVVLYRRNKALKRLLGCAPGVYALGSKMIVARSRQIRLYDLVESQPHVVHHYLNGRYQRTLMHWLGGVFSFPRPDAYKLALFAVHARLNGLRLLAAVGHRDELLALDPMGLGLALTSGSAPIVPCGPSR